MDNNKQIILDFFRKKMLMVLSTQSQKGLPQSALVAFSETEKLELIFGTSSETRKYKNLQKNLKISAVIGTDIEERITVQFEGIALEMKGKDAEECRNIHLKKNPPAKKFAFNPEQRYFKIKPTWIRYTDFNKKPEEIFEVEF